MELNAIRRLVTDDLHAVDAVLAQQLDSGITLIAELSQYIIHSGGKRIRPLLVLLCANACGYQGQQHIDLAAIVELIHTATLLHDDVVDASDLRRGHETANAIWGNQASVLVGDFLFSRAFQMMVSIQDLRILKVLSNASNTIAEGEVMQLMNCHNPELTEEHYMEVIQAKTAALFAAATQVGAMISGQPTAVENALYEYGTRVGIAFQLIDDALDYSSSAEDLGKNIGDDLAEGKPTLPLIHIMRHGSEDLRNVITNAIENSSIDNLEAIQEAIAATNAIEYTHDAAAKQVHRAINALDILPDSEFREALKSIAEFTLKRRN